MFATLREITARKSLMPACNLRLEEYGCRITKMKIDPDGIRAWLKFDGLSGALGVRTTDISLSDDAGHISFGQFDTTVPLATKILHTAFRDPIPVNPEYAPVLRFGKNRTFGNFLSLHTLHAHLIRHPHSDPARPRRRRRMVHLALPYLRYLSPEIQRTFTGEPVSHRASLFCFQSAGSEVIPFL